ncbi:MAG: DUF3540 domain-containing protein [Deltaproteobacteria bacterium]|nr:DUF3540 domain-containing protein [Deltaproteobacteria bacterium]
MSTPAPSHPQPLELPAEGAPSALELLVELDRRPEPSESPSLAYGTVTAAAPSLTVALHATERPARRAKSCLVAPEVGDRVLCSVDGATAYVLAVLDGASDTTLVSEGRLTLRATGALELASETLKIQATSAVAAIEQLRVLGRELDATYGGKVNLLAERVEARATTLLQRARQAFRFVEGLDQTRAGAVDVRAESLVSVRGETTIMAARVLAKLDGEQVKIG